MAIITDIEGDSATVIPTFISTAIVAAIASGVSTNIANVISASVPTDIADTIDIAVANDVATDIVCNIAVYLLLLTSSSPGFNSPLVHQVYV